MKSFKTFFVTGALVLLSSFMFTACETDSGASAHWRTLLDATHHDGWKMVGPGELKWENGELVTYGGMGLLYYEREALGNCEIRVIFKLTAPDDNSGVFVRIPTPPKDPWDAVNHGFEVQICNAADDWHRTGCLYSLTKAKNDVNAKVGNWSTMVITLRGNRTVIHVDGKLVTDFTDGESVPAKKIWYEPDRGPRPERGYIGLQNHGKDAHVHFKQVDVRPLK